MPTIYKLSEAIDLSKAVFYDLNAKCIDFLFRHKKQEKQMVFTSVKAADLVKALYPKFEIKLDTRKGRYAELIINYD